MHFARESRALRYIAIGDSREWIVNMLFSAASSVHGHHILYKCVWTLFIGDKYTLVCEVGNV